MISHVLGMVLAGPAAPAIDFTNVVGTWRGTTSSGAAIEEQWQPPMGDSMVGSFRMVGTDGKVVFYEILTYDVPTSILRIRHFDAELNAKEEKNAPMRFQATAPGVFKRIDSGAKDESITYVRAGDKLTITVKKPGKDPQAFELAKDAPVTPASISLSDLGRTSSANEWPGIAARALATANAEEAYELWVSLASPPFDWTDEADASRVPARTIAEDFLVRFRNSPNGNIVRRWLDRYDTNFAGKVEPVPTPPASSQRPEVVVAIDIARAKAELAYARRELMQTISWIENATMQCDSTSDPRAAVSCRAARARRDELIARHNLPSNLILVQLQTIERFRKDVELALEKKDAATAKDRFARIEQVLATESLSASTDVGAVSQYRRWVEAWRPRVAAGR